MALAISAPTMKAFARIPYRLSSRSTATPETNSIRKGRETNRKSRRGKLFRSQGSQDQHPGRNQRRSGTKKAGSAPGSKVTRPPQPVPAAPVRPAGRTHRPACNSNSSRVSRHETGTTAPLVANARRPPMKSVEAQQEQRSNRASGGKDDQRRSATHMTDP